MHYFGSVMQIRFESIGNNELQIEAGLFVKVSSDCQPLLHELPVIHHHRYQSCRVVAPSIYSDRWLCPMRHVSISRDSSINLHLTDLRYVVVDDCCWVSVCQQPAAVPADVVSPR